MFTFGKIWPKQIVAQQHPHLEYRVLHLDRMDLYGAVDEFQLYKIEFIQLNRFTRLKMDLFWCLHELSSIGGVAGLKVPCEFELSSGLIKGVVSS